MSIQYRALFLIQPISRSILHYRYKNVIIKPKHMLKKRKGGFGMKFKEFLKNFFANLKESISRFLIAFICTVLFFIAVSFEIIFETTTDEILIPLCMTFALVAVLSVFLRTVQEYITDKFRSVIQYVICIATGVVGFLLIHTYYESLYTIMAYIGIMIALVCFIFFVLMRGENRDIAFPKLVSSLVFAEAICTILSIGLSTCIGAFQSLIFSWNDSYKLYTIINLFVWIIGFVNIFLSFIPKRDVPAPQSKIFRAFVLFAGLPLYILLITILLTYLAKIVITWHMPVGEINWFASFASLFFIFFLLSVKQYNDKIAKLYVRYGGYFLAPVLIMQAIAVFERINAYGLTTPRTVSLVLILISILFIVGSVIIPKHLNKIALTSGLIVLIVTVTPFNVIDMPVASQTNILKNVLTANDMLKDGKVIPNPNVNDEDAERIISAYEYLKYNAKKVPEFIPDSQKSIKDIFGFEKKYDYNSRNNYQYCNFRTKESVDITNYDKMIECFDTDILTIEHNGKFYYVDLKEIAKNLYAQYGTENSELELYKVDENISLYFTRLNFSMDMNNGEIRYCDFGGFVLSKN